MGVFDATVVKVVFPPAATEVFEGFVVIAGDVLMTTLVVVETTLHPPAAAIV